MTAPTREVFSVKMVRHRGPKGHFIPAPSELPNCLGPIDHKAERTGDWVASEVIWMAILGALITVAILGSGGTFHGFLAYITKPLP
jgi:hypothetical protein